MIIAIDGPAGAGKSTVARLLAERLGYSYIETGAMYRAVALRAARDSVDTGDAEALERIARSLSFRFVATPEGNRVLVDGVDVTDAIRTAEVSQAASVVSTIAGVRRALVERQREMGRAGRVIMEGRDIGTKVFPGAPIKVFLDASSRERSRRRLLQEQGETAAEDMERLHKTEAEITARDRRDAERSESPLVRAPGAVYLDSSTMSIEQVVGTILELVRSRENEAR